MLSDIAFQLLQAHAEDPDHFFYGLDILGSMYHDTDVRALDAAYAELLKLGLVERAKKGFSFFGAPKSLYGITRKGAEYAARGTAA